MLLYARTGLGLFLMSGPVPVVGEWSSVSYLISAGPGCTQIVLMIVIAYKFPESLVRTQAIGRNGADRVGVRC